MNRRLFCLAAVLALTLPFGPGSIFPLGPSSNKASSAPSVYSTIGPNAVDVGNVQASGTSLSLHPSLPIPLGSTIVLSVYNNSTTPSGVVSDSQGNSYSLIASQARNNDPANAFNQLYYCFSCKALSTSDTITLTDTTAGFLFYDVQYLTGLAPGDPLDSAVTATTFGNGSSMSVTPGVPSVAGEMLFTWLSGNSSDPPIVQLFSNGIFQPPIYASAGNDATISAGLNYDLSQQTVSLTQGGSSPWAGLIVGFKLGLQTQLVNFNTTCVSGSSASIPVKVNIPAGSLIIVDSFTQAPTDGTVSWSDTKGNTYHFITGVSPNGDVANGFEVWAYATNIIALTPSDSITQTDPAGSVECPFASYSTYIHGVASPLDTAVTATASGAANSTQTVTSGVPTQTNELIYCSIGTPGNLGTATRPPAGWTQFGTWNYIMYINNSSLAAQTCNPSGGLGEWGGSVFGFETH